MEKLRNTILIASLVLVGLTMPVRAEMATMDEALTVAKNWVTTIIHHEGDWGGSKSAAVEEVKEFKRGKRVVGYFCRMKPKGYIVVSLRKELAPVKAYSATGYLDPESEEGMADMLKSDMERALNAIEKKLGPIKSARTEDVQRVLEVNQQSAWEELEPDVQTFKAGLESGAITMAYDPGTWLLTSNWHQGWPYNSKCPDKGCTEPGLNGHAYVGCTATAAAQIMRYWSWPPEYDWLNMPDSVTWVSDDDEKDAVGRLCNDAGNFPGMVYTCDFSFLLPAMMAASLENSFHYNARSKVWDPTISVSGWHKMLKEDLDNNRPVLYAYLVTPEVDNSHSVVVDGWKQVGDNLLWHINYGWSDTDTDTWYSIEGWPIAAELVQNISPAQSLGGVFAGTFTGKGYRYFNVDATSMLATFEAGQKLQFLPGVKVKCIGAPGSYIRFEGTSSENTRLYSIKGTQSAGIEIGNGAIELYPGGGLTFLSRQVYTD